MMLRTSRHPRSPIMPPTTVPRRAPTTGMGINVCPTIAPIIEEPIVVPVLMRKPVSSASFLVSVL